MSERYIRKNPEQYLWLYRRFQHIPPGAPEELRKRYPYYARVPGAKFFRKEELSIKPKRGAVILVGGGDGKIEKPYETACTLLHHMNCYDIHEVVCSFNTNVVPAIEDEAAVDGVRRIAEFLNKRD